mgnify:CR=1 FL=1
MKPAFAPFARPLYVMSKPIGSACNLACDYCYYLEKANLYKQTPKQVMSDELLEKFISEYIGSQTMPEVLFTYEDDSTAVLAMSFVEGQNVLNPLFLLKSKSQKQDFADEVISGMLEPQNATRNTYVQSRRCRL